MRCTSPRGHFMKLYCINGLSHCQAKSCKWLSEACNHAICSICCAAATKNNCLAISRAFSWSLLPSLCSNTPTRMRAGQFGDFAPFISVSNSASPLSTAIFVTMLFLPFLRSSSEGLVFGSGSVFFNGGEIFPLKSCTSALSSITLVSLSLNPVSRILDPSALRSFVPSTDSGSRRESPVTTHDCLCLFALSHSKNFWGASTG